MSRHLPRTIQLPRLLRSPSMKDGLGRVIFWVVGIGYFLCAVAQEAQTVSWTAPTTSTILLLGKAYPLTATSSSGLPVKFSVGSGPATISAGQLVATNLGLITVVAEQSGDATHGPVRVERRFNRPRHILEKESVWPESVRGLPWDIAVFGSRAYVAEDYLGMQILDVSQPNRAVVLGTWMGLRGTETMGVQVSGTTVFISDDEGIQILDASDPGNVRQIGTYDDLGGGVSFSVSGSRLILWTSPLEILDISDPAKPVKVGEYDPSGWGEARAVQEGFVYAGALPNSLKVLDIRVPGSIGELGGVEGLSVGAVSGLAVVGSIAHVVGDMGYAMVDVADPLKPREVAYFRTPHRATGVGVHGSRVVVSGVDRCRVLDVSNPSAIREIWSGPGRAWGSGIPTVDGKAFLRGEGSVVVLDLNGPDAVQIFSRTTLAGNANGFGVLDGHIWLADTEGGIKAFAPGASKLVEAPLSTLVNPLGMDRFGDQMVVVGMDAEWRSGLDIVSSAAGLPSKIVGSWRANHAPGLAKGVVIANNHAYVIGNELNVYNISDPRAPKWVGVVEARRFDEGDEWGLQVVGDAVYFSDIGGVYRLDSTAPSRPPELVLEAIGLGRVRFKVSPDSLRLYRVAGGIFEVWDIKNTASPKRLGSASVGDESVGQLEIDGGTAWLLGWDSLKVLDVSDPTAIKILPPIGSPTQLVGVAVKDGTLYLSNLEGTKLLDVRDPAHPKLLGQTPGTPSKILVQGGTAFLIDELSQLSVLDVSDPKNIRQLQGLKMHGNLDLDVSGGRIALAAGGKGLLLLERLANGDLSFLGAARSSGEVRRVRVSGNRAYLAEKSAGVRIISLEDPTQPKEIGWVDTPDSPNDVAIEGNLIYVAASRAGFQIFDVIDPAKPVHVGEVGPPKTFLGTLGEAAGIQFVGKTAYVSYFPYGGVQVLDISDSAHPKEISYLPEIFFMTAFEVVGDRAFFIGGYPKFSIVVYDMSQPAKPFPLDSWDTDIRNSWHSRPHDLKVVGDKVYVAAGIDGVLAYRLRLDDRLLQNQTDSLPWEMWFAGAEDPGLALPGSGFLVSGQVPTYSVVSGPARIESGRLVAGGLGEVVLKAAAPGNLQFYPYERQTTIEVKNYPVLEAKLSGQTLTFAEWPWGFVLQRSATLSSAVWQDVSDSWPVEVPLTEDAGYFRLFRAQ